MLTTARRGGGGWGKVRHGEGVPACGVRCWRQDTPRLWLLMTFWRGSDGKLLIVQGAMHCPPRQAGPPRRPRLAAPDTHSLTKAQHAAASREHGANHHATSCNNNLRMLPFVVTHGL